MLKVAHDIDAISKNHKVHLWASLPCRPWSQWNELNGRKLGPKFRAYLEVLRDESLELIRVFAQLARKVTESGGTVSFEWPAYCVGWEVTELNDVLQELGFEQIICHGCAFGLSHRGRPIKKPWRIASNHQHLLKL